VAHYFGMMIGLYALTSWAPQLVKSLSSLYSNSMVGFLLAIPHLIALAAMILVSRSGRGKDSRASGVASWAREIATQLNVSLGTLYNRLR
jgi:hypothetical protein